MMNKKHKETNFLDAPVPSMFLAMLIVLSAVSFSIETLPDINESLRQWLRYFEWFAVVVFTIEYLWRVYSAKNKRGFVFSFYGIIDLLAILPFYLTLAVDLRTLRVLRLIRLLRLLKLARYTAAMNRITLALVKAKEELIVSTFILALVVYVAAFGIYHFEHAVQPEKFRSIFDALWWSVATVTTVGYGDIYPVTTWGRLFTFVMLIASLGLVSVPTGIFATALFSVRRAEEAGQLDLSGEIDEP